PGVHVVGSTLTVDTVSDGTGMLAKYCWIALSRNRLKPTMPPPMRTSRMKAMMKRLITDGPSGGVWYGWPYTLTSLCARGHRRETPVLNRGTYCTVRTVLSTGVRLIYGEAWRLPEEPTRV